MSTYKPGDKVRFIDAVASKYFSLVFPAVGRTGTVVQDLTDTWGDIEVKWDGDGAGISFCKPEQIEPAEEGTANE